MSPENSDCSHSHYSQAYVNYSVLVTGDGRQNTLTLPCDLNISFSSPPVSVFGTRFIWPLCSYPVYDRRLGASLFARAQRNWSLCWASMSLTRQTACSEIVTILNYSLCCKACSQRNLLPSRKTTLSRWYFSHYTSLI